MNSSKLEALVRRCLEEFYRRRIENLSKLSRDLLNEFADESGLLDWEKIVRFNSEHKR